MKQLVAAAVWVLLVGCNAVDNLQTTSRQPYDSGGPVRPEQAAFDVLHYDLSLRIDPEQRVISGELAMRALALQPMDRVLLDLDPVFEVFGAWQDPDVGRQQVNFTQSGPELWIDLIDPADAGDTVELVVAYGGQPRQAPMPPWQGGFSWAETADGHPWVGVSCQVDGADVWWPCKDHPSDEPDDGVGLHFTVPEDLTVVSNGRLLGVTDEDEGWRTFHWRVSTPINIYDVTVNAAPFIPIETTYTDVLGESHPVTWWALPESVERGRKLLDEFVLQLRFLETELGPYPFWVDKAAVVHTPYLAMEHQTAISLGLDGDARRAGFSYILLHELTHEWWGNMVSAADWRDFWLHEGFDGYMEARYAEFLGGEDAYHDYMNRYFSPGVLNQRPVAPPEPSWLREVFVTVEDDQGGYATWDVDAYLKGALILHTLRYVVGDEVFADVLRRWAYPDPAAEGRTDGGRCRSVTTEQFQEHVETMSGLDLGWFFEAYLRQPELPNLVTQETENRLELRWEAPEHISFPMPVDVQIGDEVRRVEMTGGEGRIELPAGAEWEVDPQSWILRQ